MIQNKVKIRGNDLYERIEKEYKQSMKIYDEMISEKDWEVQGDSDGIKSFFKHEENSPVYSIKFEGEVDYPMLNLLSIFYEIDLYPKWCPYMTLGETLKEESRYRFFCKYEFDMPW